jgi:hypothetical protein
MRQRGRSARCETVSNDALETSLPADTPQQRLPTALSPDNDERRPDPRAIRQRLARERGELCALQWQHVDFKRQTLHIAGQVAHTTMLLKGIDVRTAAGRLGHARASTTLDIYAHQTQPADQRASDTLADSLDAHRCAEQLTPLLGDEELSAIISHVPNSVSPECIQRHGRAERVLSSIRLSGRECRAAGGQSVSRKKPVALAADLSLSG